MKANCRLFPSLENKNLRMKSHTVTKSYKAQSLWYLVRIKMTQPKAETFRWIKSGVWIILGPHKLNICNLSFFREQGTKAIVIYVLGQILHTYPRPALSRKFLIKISFEDDRVCHLQRERDSKLGRGYLCAWVGGGIYWRRFYFSSTSIVMNIWNCTGEEKSELTWNPSW